MKIIQYEIATSKEYLPIQIDVLQKNNQGFELYGSPFIDGLGIVCQAMVKYEEEKLESKVRKLADFTLSYHKDMETLERIKMALTDEGWEFFRADIENHPNIDKLMSYKLMMVKYEQ